MPPIKRRIKRLLKGKVFRKSEFGTGFSDKTLRGRLLPAEGRTEGVRAFPVVLELPSEPGIESAALEPVRIFIGTEPAQHRAERVLLWSILKHRSPRRAYQVYLMKDIKGLDRRKWKTGFTGYRYAIPAWAGFSGRAIYNDVDQIYLRDPAELFSLDMDSAGVLAVESRDTSVMLMDCDLLSSHWNLDTLRDTDIQGMHTSMLRRVRAAGLISDLPPQWNARDHEYAAQNSCLLHYTILHTQPWQPFPRALRYRPNPLAHLWFELEAEADEASFAMALKTGVEDYEALESHFRVQEPPAAGTLTGRTGNNGISRGASQGPG